MVCQHIFSVTTYGTDAACYADDNDLFEGKDMFAVAYMQLL
jgi:hypothetical protein